MSRWTTDTERKTVSPGMSDSETATIDEKTVLRQPMIHRRQPILSVLVVNCQQDSFFSDCLRIVFGKK